MTKHDPVAELEESEVYLVETDEPASLIGEYAGVDDRGRLTFISRQSPLYVPPERVVDALRLS